VNSVPVDVIVVFSVALASALATGLGALPFAFKRHPDRRWLGLANGLAAGFMIGASFGLLYEGGRESIVRTGVGAVGGAIFILASRRLVAGRDDLRLGPLQGADATRALLIVGVMTLHSFSEGVGIGVAFGGDEALALLIALSITVHNIPEGLAISLVLVPRGASARSAAGWSIFSSLPQPLMAVPAYVFVETFGGFLPVGLGFAAGAMLWLVAADLVPEARETTSAPALAIAIGGSSLAMLAFIVALVP
jgi:zinc transporter ZupT